MLMKDDFLKEFAEFEDVFEIVEEPTYSKAILEKYESKYTFMNSRLVYWYYKIQGFTELRDYIHDVDDWAYYYERFLRYDGDPFELCDNQNQRGQADRKIQNEKKTSGSCKPLVLF